jgi:hypothetical protein
MRCFELENRTASEIVKLICKERWTEGVDLVEGGHTTVFFLPSELAGAKSDFEAANAAGIDLKDVHWLTREEMEVVSPCLNLCLFSDAMRLEIRHLTSWRRSRWLQSLALEIRYTVISAGEGERR